METFATDLQGVFGDCPGKDYLDDRIQSSHNLDKQAQSSHFMYGRQVQLVQMRVLSIKIQKFIKNIQAAWSDFVSNFMNALTDGYAMYAKQV